VPHDTARGLPIGRYLPDLKWGGGGKNAPRVFSRELEVFYPRQRYLHLYAVPLSGEAAGGGAVLILRDVTGARKAAADTVESERNEALNLLAAGVAHEIGNPLNSLHIHLQLMDRELRDLDSEKREALQESLRVARAEVSRLDRIVSQFLEALRPTPPRMELLSANPIVEESVRFMSTEIQNCGISVEVNLARNLPRVWLDRDQMKQVFFNLIKNALQAMTRGGRLTLTTEATPDDVLISVADSGAGIPPERIGRIFDPYQTTRREGSGLGLMIVRRIVQEHGGAIDVDSRVGKGTVFRVRLPIREKRARLLEAAATPPLRELELVA
jgi:signal transduction histidine kinase